MTDALIRISRGLWRPAHALSSPDDHARALLDVCPPGTVVADLTAARWHGFWLPEASGQRVDVVVHGAESFPRDHPASRRPELRARRRRLIDEDVCFRDGVWMTTPERTWVDLAQVLRYPDLVAAGDSALRLGVSVDALASAVARARRQRGVVRARQAVLALDARSRSRGESHLRCAVTAPGAPIPQVNVAVYDADGGWLGEPDLSYDDVRLALEYNGADHAAPDRMRRDITRELDFENRGGWRVLVFGPAEVFGRPWEVAATVARVRAERQHRFARVVR